jgi:hypothetical protein
MSAPLSLLEELARVPDPRSPQGTRHPLPAILGLTVLAMLCGCKSYTAIAQFGRDKGFASPSRWASAAARPPPSRVSPPSSAAST